MISYLKTKTKKIFLILCASFFFSNISIYADERMEAAIDQINIISKDLKTLEKAVYKSADALNLNNSNPDINEDILAKHLLKLNDIENQFRELTNRFEEINFKMDKLSRRVTKIQSDTQMRISDLEEEKNFQSDNKISKEKTKDKFRKEKVVSNPAAPQDFGALPGYEKKKELPEQQQVNSVATAETVITSKAERAESLLPNKPPKDQYDFAINFMKIGDYETAEFALKEFIEKNQEHDLAGSAQYWYGETFRIRQLYSDAASAYLDGYQNYPKSKKAPDNLLKLGITMVQLGEKDQGCKMIAGIKKQYPNAKQSVIQKAQYEQKKFKCKV
ncbi:MAG: tol-pal system protein YbgF [Candidatus Pelagibacter sp.]|nr:tol-pal system protein YbgF [Candidatus Pelagibacter sp.]OUW23913.1 MAG: tol-pal system protein YbgF [Rickettsiales bacterium TMED174]